MAQRLTVGELIKKLERIPPEWQVRIVTVANRYEVANARLVLVDPDSDGELSIATFGDVSVKRGMFS
jgi:hypothetical protein